MTKIPSWGVDLGVQVAAGLPCFALRLEIPAGTSPAQVEELCEALRRYGESEEDRDEDLEDMRYYEGYDPDQDPGRLECSYDGPELRSVSFPGLAKRHTEYLLPDLRLLPETFPLARSGRELFEEYVRRELGIRSFMTPEQRVASPLPEFLRPELAQDPFGRRLTPENLRRVLREVKTEAFSGKAQDPGRTYSNDFSPPYAAATWPTWPRAGEEPGLPKFSEHPERFCRGVSYQSLLTLMRTVTPLGWRYQEAWNLLDTEWDVLCRE